MSKVIAENPLQKLWLMEENDTDLPRGAKVIGSNGVFHTSNSAILDVVQKSQGTSFPGLVEIEENASVKIKIPSDIFWVGPRWLYKMWNTNAKKEYIIILMYHPVMQAYAWIPPKQTGTVASLSYAQSDDEDIRNKMIDGWLVVGTMHNHFGNRGSAFQSGTDKHDEEKVPGAAIHFTMGYMDAPSVYMAEFHTRIVSGDFAKVIDLQDAVEDFKDALPMPDAWDEKVKIPYKPPVTTTIKHTVSLMQPTGVPNHQYKDYRSYFGFGAEDINDEEYAKWYSQGDDPSTVSPPEDGGFYSLSDLEIMFDDPEFSGYYKDTIAQHPKVFKFAGGQQLLHGMVMLGELKDAIDNKVLGGNIFKMEDYEDIIKDVITALDNTEQLLGEFISEQNEA